MVRAYGFLSIAVLLNVLAGHARDSQANDSWIASVERHRSSDCLPSQEWHGDVQTPPCLTATETMPVIIIPPVSVTPTLEPSSPPRDEILAFLRQLRIKILESRQYPLDARKLGLEGTVTVAFNLMPDGQAQAMKVRKTSGHSLLDEAALDAVQRVLPFKPPLKPGGLPLELSVPISFTLR